MLIINGNNCDAIGMTISEYLTKENYDEKRVAVERNGEIIPKPQYSAVIHNDGDTVEVISFVGGGWFKFTIRKRNVYKK